MGSPNWGKLVRQGRAKAPGVPWNDAELHALHQLGIPVEYVRSGVLTEEDYEEAHSKDEKDGKELTRCSVEELKKLADENDIKYVDGVSREMLILLLQQDGVDRRKVATNSKKSTSAKKKTASKKKASKKKAEKEEDSDT